MRHNGAKILLDNFREFLQSTVHVKEEYTLLLKVFSDGVVNSLGFVLSRYSTEPLLFGLGDTQTVECVLDVFWNIIPVVFGRIR